MITYDSQNVGDLTSTDLFFLNLIGNNSTKNKEKVCDYYHLGHCNGKTLLKRLNMLHISKEELEKLIDD